MISPKDGKATFDDIFKAEQNQREVKEKWGKWQEVRETEYREALEIDKSENLTPKQKAVAWQRFLAAISQDNPHSRKDDEMRSHSRSRATHWEDVKPVKKAEPLSPAGSEGEVIASDGTLVAYATGVVYDKNTGLEWLAGPDRDTTWDGAKSWVENLTVAGRGWRLPTRKELKTLYQKGAGTRNMTSLLKTTGWRVWSGETEDSLSAWLFSFSFGNESWYFRSFSSYGERGFGVRSRR